MSAVERPYNVSLYLTGGPEHGVYDLPGYIESSAPAPELCVMLQHFPEEGTLSVQYVVALQYVLDVSTLYEDAPPLEFVHSDMAFRLEHGRLLVRLNRQCATVQEARERVEPVLRSWEFQDSVILGFGEAVFAYLDAEFDSEGSVLGPPADPLRNLPDDGGVLRIAIRHFAQPPEVRVTPELSAAWDRWQRARIGIGESMQAAAYFALTVIESAGGGRREAANAFKVDVAVLRRVGELASITGGLTSARKALGSEHRDLSSFEKHWLGIAIRALLLNAGQHAAGNAPERITMSSLPQPKSPGA